MTIELWCAAAVLSTTASFLLLLVIEFPWKSDGEQFVDLSKVERIDDWQPEPVSHSGQFARYIDRTSGHGEA